MRGRGWAGGGYGRAFLLHPIVMLFALVGLAAVVMWLVRMLNHGSPYQFHGEGVPSGRPGQGRALENSRPSGLPAARSTRPGSKRSGSFSVRSRAPGPGGSLTLTRPRPYKTSLPESAGA